MVQVRRRVTAGAAALAVAALGFAGASQGIALAQEGTPTAGMLADIPNHIHQGTCANLSETIVAPLASISFGAVATQATPGASPMAGMATPGADAMATPMADGAMMATPLAGMEMGQALPVAVASTTVPLPLTQILSAPHAINFHDPAAPQLPTRYLACGDLAGAPDAQGNLFVGLGELNGSGVTGTAWLLDDGTGATTVTVFLNRAMAGM